MATCKRTFPAFLTILALAAASRAGAAETFYQSDDYDEDDEIVGKFLADDDYKLMVSDISRNGAELDWGWALTSGGESKKKPSSKVKSLGFALEGYHTVSVSMPKNLIGLTRDEADALHEALMAAMGSLGLEIVEPGEEADLELTSAAVDLSREGGGFGWIQIQPFVEVELRLAETQGHRTLLLIRDQSYGYNAYYAAADLGSELAKFLR